MSVDPSAPSGATCAWCGASADPVPPTWSMSVTERGAEWLCEECARRNIRAIEGRLEPEWW